MLTIKPVFDRKKTATATKAAKVVIEIVFSRTSRRWISTDIELYSNQWEDGLVVRHPYAKNLNRRISSIIRDYHSIIRSMEEDGREITADSFRSYTEAKNHVQDSFIDFCYDVMESRHLRPATIRAHRHTFDTLRAFGRIRTFDDLTPSNLRAFDTFLKKMNPDMTQVTLYGYHKRLKPYINEAVERGILDESPYNRYKVRQGKSKPREALNEAELQSIRDIVLPDGSLSLARDLFIFCAYTGLSHVDMQTFDFGRDASLIKDIYYIDSERIKTGTRYYTPILPPAMEVLEKYNYHLPHISQQAYNRLLKCIAAMIGTKKNLSSHIARYTFATTVLLAHDVPIESVSKMLGHTRIQITQLYAKILNSTVERQAQRLANIL